MEQINKHQLKKADQQLFTDSFNFCWELLKKKEYYLSERETNIFSKLSLNYGHDMYKAMVIFMKRIIISHKHKVAVEKSKIGSIKIVTTKATRDSGCNDNYNQFNQQQQKQVDKVHSQDKNISKKKKVSVDEIRSKKKFKADNKKNNCGDSSNTKNIQITSLNGNSIEKLHMIDFIKKEEELFTEESITIKDEPVTDDSINVDEINNSYEHSMGRVIGSNRISNLFDGNHQSCSNKVIDNVDHQKNTRIGTGSLAPKKYSVYTGEDDELSSTKDENHFDDNDVYDNDDDYDAGDDDYDYDCDDNDDDFDCDDDNNLNQNENLDKIKVSDEISFKERARIVKLATENPTWSLSMLRKRSGCNITHRHQVEVWKKHIQQGGSLREKMNFVNNWVINKCIENQKKGEIITNKKIRAFGLEAKKIFKPMKFLAGHGWLRLLKINYKITGEPNNLKINCNLQKKKSLSYSRIYVPHEIKVKVVNLANENPHWSLEMLREQSGCNNLDNICQLNNWKHVVSNFNKKRATSFSTIKNKHKVTVEKSKVESIKSVAAEATRGSGYDDNYDQSNQQQQQKQVDGMILKKRKISADAFHSENTSKADNKKNNCDDSSNAKNVQIVSSNGNSIEKLHMIDFIEKEEELFTEESIIIKDEMWPVTDDSINVDKISNSNDHSIALDIKPNEISNFFKDNNQSCLNEVIENVNHPKTTRINTGSLAPRKYSCWKEDNDSLSSTTDKNYFDDDYNDVEADDDDVMNNLNKNKKLKDEIKIVDDISFEEKTLVVKLAIEHPTWSLNMLREHSGCKNIKSRYQVEEWKKQIQQGGSSREKINYVNNWVINKCIENQKKGEIITNKKIKTWGLEAKKIFKPIRFSASDGWLMKLKINHKITGNPENLKINCNLQKKKSFSFSRVYVPHEIKAKVVNLAKENPHWSLKMLRKQSGCDNLETINQLYYWKYAVSNFNKKRATGSKVPEKFKSTSVRYRVNDEYKNASSSRDRSK